MSESKEKLNESDRELRGLIIEKMNEIESQMNLAISDYFKPKDKGDFIEIMLNTSIVSIGGKFKILKNINSFDKKIINDIQKISAIRNYFAHARISGPLNLTVTQGENSQKLFIPKQIRYMNSNGVIKQTATDELIMEFHDLHKKIMKHFMK
ncbi:hypothetical protein [Psychroserpens sp. Hel_I_66]|uniref:hypothetical protein n=1 Tax=Psychroserpens sp. Hel_I_66 TaxID=1250004 RepID=UPI000648CFF5|nr:hypothetical protein [Psychroserpens sp. Hel_I_66]